MNHLNGRVRLRAAGQSP